MKIQVTPSSKGDENELHASVPSGVGPLGSWGENTPFSSRAHYL